MTTLSSKIPGMNIWAYDIARRPVKELDSMGGPQMGVYTSLNTQGDVVKPVTQHPTEFLDKPYNYYRYICDVRYIANGNFVKTHGIKSSPSDPIDQQIKPDYGSSDKKFSPVIFVGDDVYIQKGDYNPLDKTKKPAFTTSTPGITILDQTGIVTSQNGFAVVVFEVEQGYKIPKGSTIKANPTISTQSMGGRESPDTPETYPAIYDLMPGAYEMTVTDDPNIGWDTCDIDFATVQYGTVPPVVVPPVVVPPVTGTPTTPQAKTVKFGQTLSHAQSNVPGDSIDRTLNAISLTADPGYLFKTDIQIVFYTNGEIASQYNFPGNGASSITVPLNTTKENTITKDMDGIRLIANATQSTLQSGYEHNYLISDTELSSFGKDRIFSYGAQAGDEYDVTPFINNVIQLPFKVDAQTTFNRITVGRIQSNVFSNEASSRFVVLDLGTIQAQEKYHNGYDYQNQSVKLYTPFVPPISIDNQNAIGKTIHISYKIDISNGNCTVNLDNDGVLFFTGISNISSQLPFLNTLKNTIINRDTHFNDNGIRQPYLIITRETPILNNDYYPTNERGLIKNYNGNVKVRVLNNMNIPNNELSELTNQLESGVKYVKGN